VTRAEAATYIKHLLFEDAATTGLASTAQLNLTIDAANVAVWQRASIRQPSLFSETPADLTYVAATGYHDLSALTVVPSTLNLVSVLSGGRYYPIEEMKVTEKDKVDLYSPVPGSSIPVAYWLDGERLKFIPAPASNLTFRLNYVGRPTPMTGDADKLLLGKMVEWHLLVCYEAALVLAIKDEADGMFRGIKFVRDEMRESLDRWLGKRSNARPHFIREVAF
jgi:hypothetical protein